MKVGSTLLQQLADRLLKNIENELRLEALLLGETLQESTSVLKQLVLTNPCRDILTPTGRGKDPMLNAYRHAMLYGTSVHQVIVRPQGEQISGAKANLAVLDEVSFKDIEELSAQLYANMQTAGTVTSCILDMEDMYIRKTWESEPPPSSPQWPASHQGKKGPAPRKPFRNR